MKTHTLGIIPEPQNTRLTGGEFVFNGGVEIVAGEQPPFLAKLLESELGRQFNIKAAQGAKAGRIFLELDKNVRTRDQGYCLDVSKERIRIISSGVQGLFYGIQSFLMLPKKTGRCYKIPCLKISDWPDLTVRGVHVYMGSHVGHYPVFINMIKELARHKINMLILEYEDKFPYKSHPVIAAKHAFSPHQIKAMADLAAGNQIELVPLRNSLGHAELILKHQEYAHLKELPDHTAEMCPLNPGTLKLVKDLYRDLFPSHPSKYFHVGGDEVFRLGDFCPKCREFIKAQGKSALFVEYYTKLCNWLRAQGKTPVIWGDMFVNHPEAIERFPKGVIIMDWDYSGRDSDTSPCVLYKMITEDTLKHLPGHIRKTFEPYWRNRYYPKMFKAYPYVKFFQDHGFKVIGASASSMLDFSGRYINNRRFSQRLVSEKSLGLMNTNWPQSPIESSWYGLLAGAEHSWNSAGVSKERFDDKFVASYFGIDPQRHKLWRGVAQLEKVLVNQDEGENSWVVRKRRADEALAALQAARHYVKKNPVQLEYLEILARDGSVSSRLELLACEAENILLGLGGKHKCRFVDLSAQANRGFRNNPIYNLRSFPHGRLCFRGIPFSVLDQEKNKGNACIFLKGTRLYGPEYPKEINGVRVNCKASRLYFLHSGYQVDPARKGEMVCEYRMRYADGTEAVKPIINQEGIADSFKWKPPLPQLTDGFVAWKGGIFPGEQEPFALAYVVGWDNPRPDKVIESITLVSGEIAVPIIIAITAEIRLKKAPAKITRARRIMRELGAIQNELTSLSRTARMNYRKFIIPSDVQGLIDTTLADKSKREHIKFLLGRLAAFIRRCG